MTHARLIGCTLLMAVAWPAAAHAQDAKPEVSGVETLDQTVNHMSKATDCAQLLNKHKGQVAQIKQWESLGSKLGWLGAGLTAISVYNDSRQGNYGAAADTVVNEGICTALGPYCAPYAAGKKIGEILDSTISAAVGSDRTLNEMWTDTLVGWVYGSGEPSAAQIDQMIAKHRQKLQEMQAAAEPPPPMCKLEEAKDTFTEMLEKAKAESATQLSTSIPTNLGSLTSDAITTADRASSDAAAASAATIQAMNSRLATQTQQMNYQSNSTATETFDLCARVREEAPKYDLTQQDVTEGLASYRKETGQEPCQVYQYQVPR